MPKQDALTKEIELEFLRQVDEWFSKGMDVWDNELDRQIAKWYSEAKDTFPKRPYFSPSSLNSCQRELYLKAKNAKRDKFPRQPHQGRWQRLGGLGGDMLQRELLMMERHYEEVVGEPCKFKFVRNDDGTPMFEEFAATNLPISIDDQFFYLFGMPDGVMEYTDDDGNVTRVGLEIKSKQTTNARTSAFSMREVEADHMTQTIAYSAMYDCDYYLVVYLNYSKKSWNMSDEDYEKTPDLRVFCNLITEQDIFEKLLYAAEVQNHVKAGKPPKLDITKWTFNNYKTACARHLTTEEVIELEEEVDRLMGTPLKAWERLQLQEALEQVKELRK